MRTALVALLMTLCCVETYAALPHVGVNQNIPDPPPMVACTVPSNVEVEEALARVDEALSAAEEAQVNGAPAVILELLLDEAEEAVEYMLELMIEAALGACAPS